MADLNRTYRNKEGPTNVLAFSMQEGDFGDLSPLLGDVVISVDTAAKEAAELSIPLDIRITQLLVHGVLHLFDYDHERGEEEEAKMAKKSLELVRMVEGDPSLPAF